MNLIWALVWNVGTCVLMIREEFKWKNHENQSTEAVSRGRSACSSEEAAVMVVERRG
jgi:hypothetical protein